MRLDDIDWPGAIAAARSRTAGDRLAADVESLSALFAADYADGVGRVRRAETADPYNPLHRVRLALVNMRFGQWDAAQAACQSVADEVPGAGLPVYLRALAALRKEEAKRAANIAQDATAANPDLPLARFLHAEATLSPPGKAARKVLAALPRGPDAAAAWADLLAKMAVGGSAEGKALAEQGLADPRALPPGSAPRAALAKLLDWLAAGPDALAERLAAVPAGSRAEEVILLLAHDRLAQDVPAARRLHDRFPDRPAVRRLYVALLARQSVVAAAAEKYADALRLVERCAALEPHDPTHLQNRAALFTLMREPDASHDAWADLNRHAYRRALLGELSPADAAHLAKPHRLFAEQARSNSSPPGVAPRQHFGLFLERTVQRDGGPTVIAEVNQERIDADPDLLRQWLHHRRAELVFSHLALGWDPRRFLLGPEDRRTAKARLAGLALSARSLETLVPEEGAMLGGRVVAAWRRQTDRLPAAYAPPADDPAVSRLRVVYTQALADVVHLCVEWKPDGRRPDIAEEVLEFLDSVGPFFHPTTLAAALKDPAGSPPFGLRMLSWLTDEVLGPDPARVNLTPDQRTAVLAHAAARLVSRLAYAVYDAARGGRDAAGRPLALAERAQKLDPSNPRHQLLAVRFMLLGGYFAEARAALPAAQRAAAKDPELAAEAEELRKILADQARGDGRTRADDPPADEPIPDRVADLERELADAPAAVHLFEELARALASAGRVRDAAGYSARAMAQCLERESQFRARSLDLEVLGLEALAGRDPTAVRLYLSGAHRPAVGLIESIPADGRPAPVLYLYGQCLLALNRPEDARAAFEAALAKTDRQPHRAVLRRLAADVDQPYLLVARRAVADHLRAGAFEDAAREVWEAVGRLRRPELGFLDLARVHLEAATARLGTGRPPLPRYPARVGGPWAVDLDAAYVADTDLGRARRLIELTREANPTAADQANQLARKADALAGKEATATLLVKAAELVREKRFADALAAIDAAGPAAADPRVERQRVLLLLNVERFEEADAACRAHAATAAPGAADFAAAYPGVAFRLKMAAAVRLIRTGSDERAAAVLPGVVPPTAADALELGYCRAFCRTLEGRRHRRQGRPADARRALTAALAEVEQHLSAARAAGHAQMLELYAALDDELGIDA